MTPESDSDQVRGNLIGGFRLQEQTCEQCGAESGLWNGFENGWEELACKT